MSHNNKKIQELHAGSNQRSISDNGKLGDALEKEYKKKGM